MWGWGLGGGGSTQYNNHMIAISTNIIRKVFLYMLLLHIHPCINSQTSLDVNSEYESTFSKVYKENNWNIAVIKANEDLKINPTSINAYYLRGIARNMLKDYSNAISDFSKVIELDNQNADAYGERGIAKDNIGDSRGAISDYTKCLEYNPNKFFTYANRSISKKKLKDFRGALIDINKAIDILDNISLNKSNTDSDYLLKSRYLGIRASILEVINKYDEAIDSYTLAISLDPKNAEAYSGRGILRIIIKQDKDGGCLDLSRAGELGLDVYQDIELLCNK